MEKINKWLNILKIANTELQEKEFKRWLTYCLGVMIHKMDDTDIQVMQSAIPNYKEIIKRCR